MNKCTWDKFETTLMTTVLNKVRLMFFDVKTECKVRLFSFDSKTRHLPGKQDGAFGWNNFLAKFMECLHGENGRHNFNRVN